MYLFRTQFPKSLRSYGSVIVYQIYVLLGPYCFVYFMELSAELKKLGYLCSTFLDKINHFVIWYHHFWMVTMCWTCCKAIPFRLNCHGPPAQDTIFRHSNLLGILLPAHLPCLFYAFVFLIPFMMTAIISNYNHCYPLILILPAMQLLIIPLIIILSHVVSLGFKLLGSRTVYI